jgi:putative membrane-bound dehydrogenase-like protein
MRKLVCLSLLMLLGAEPAVGPKDLPRFPAVEPADALKTFTVKEGFKIELVAAEPLVVDPVAMAFDEEGHLFVVEMRDYSERREEKLGRVRMLSDTDGDGIFDKSTIYADNLPWPTAITCWKGGVFVGATPDVFYLKDTNGDGIADENHHIFAGFGNTTDRLNVQQLFNSLTWGLDNRIHGASGGNGGVVRSPQYPDRQGVDLRGHDFSFNPANMGFRAESGGGQYGLGFDDTFRKFVCSNSHHIQTIMYELRYSGRNPNYAMPGALVDIAADGPAAEVYRTSPEEPWRVIRTKWRVNGLVPGPIEGGGRSAGYFTGATGVTIFRGDAWGPEYVGDAFIGDAGGNLVHRKKIRADGLNLIAERPADEQKREFLSSKDTWFRPVQMANGPDGNLYICDMYREVIEHPWSLPESIKKNLDLNSGNDRGRIYRIVKEGAKSRPLMNMAKMNAAELVAMLESANGWTRHTAARLIYERQDQDAADPLIKLLKGSKSPPARMHALYALDGLNQLNANLLSDALADKDAIVRRHAVRLCEHIGFNRQAASTLLPRLLGLVDDPDILVRYQLAFTLGELPSQDRSEMLAMLAQRNARDRWMSAAILSSIGDGAGDAFASLIRVQQFKSSREGRDFLHQLVALIAAGNRPEDLKQLRQVLAESKDKLLVFSLARGLSDMLKSKQSLQEFPELKPVFDEAVKICLDANAEQETRLQAIDFLSVARNQETQDTLLALLSRREPAAIQSAAIAALDRRDVPTLSQNLIAQWPQLTPQVRSAALSALLKRPERCIALLKAMDENSIRISDLNASQLSFLCSHPDAKVVEAAKKVLGKAISPPRQQVIDALTPALQMAGHAEEGKKIYLERCASCHRVGTDGFALGPDLVTVKNSGREKLLVNILDPNREVASQYSAYLVETKDGESILGIIVNDTATSITLRQAYGTETVVFRSNIKKLKNQGQSLMPEGLEEGLKPQNVANLLQFIETVK